MSPLLALNGHRLVRCTSLLLTQSGHWSRVRHLESRLNTLKYLTVPTKGLIYSLDSARYRCKSESSRCTGSEKIAAWALGQRCSRCASSWRCRLATFISKTFKHLLATAAAQLQDQAGGPADDDHGKPEHDFCAICAALSLTSSSVLPTVSLLPVPAYRPYEWVSDFRTAQVSSDFHFHFQARAPPPA